ncbi:MAG: hypothetical protein ISR47_06960 [Rhodospirillales bacterium]|nr:hypothetical protein [Rhodospirillales bacterium]
MSRNIRNVMVVGSGVMGRGIAKSFANGGFETVILSRAPQALNCLPPGVRAIGKPPVDAPDLIIESVPEILDLKIALFLQLDAAYRGKAIIASNTSCLPLEELAAPLNHPESFCGLHYFQPAETFGFVELIRIAATADDVFDAVAVAVVGTGKQPLRLEKPVIGFLINRLQHAMAHEAYYLMEQGVVDAETLDVLFKNLLGPRMCVTGMLEQKDMSGLDTHALSQSAVVPHLHHGAEPSRIVQDMHARGDLGAKTAKGFYDWRDVDLDARLKRNADKLARILEIVCENQSVGEVSGIIEGHILRIAQNGKPVIAFDLGQIGFGHPDFLQLFGVLDAHDPRRFGIDAEAGKQCHFHCLTVRINHHRDTRPFKVPGGNAIGVHGAQIEFIEKVQCDQVGHADSGRVAM